MGEIIKRFREAESGGIDMIDKVFYEIFNSNKTIEEMVRLYFATLDRMKIVSEDLAVEYVGLGGEIFKWAEENNKTSEFYSLIGYESEQEIEIEDRE